MRLFIIFSLAVVVMACKNSGKKKDEPPTKDTTVTLPDTTRPVTRDSLTGAETDAATVNKLLEAIPGNWRVLADKDAKADPPQNYNEVVMKERQKDPGFPFLVSGDFDGDNVKDYAALVTNDKMEYEKLTTRVAILPSGGKPILTNGNCFTFTYLRAVRKSTVIEDPYGEEKMTLKYDAIDVNNHDGGGYYLVWNGKKFEIVFEEG